MFITPSVNTGMCYTKYTHVQPKKDPLTYIPQYTSWFIETQLSFNFVTDAKVAMSFQLSYVIVDHVWDPTFIKMEDWISLSGTNQNGITSYINLGFGMYFGMGNGKKVAGK
ncbi:MAG: hypothetical protein IAF38_22410 [Bacteroidia bacterium]|nr:hypothetical protein [Bacteroidia bacterium]